MRITAACPANLVSDANHLAMCLAFGPADIDTYRGLNWQDGSGNFYAAASFEARDEWVIAAQSALQRPLWDTENIIDMIAAQRAQNALVFSFVPVTATPTSLTAIGGLNGPDALQAMGLLPVESI